MAIQPIDLQTLFSQQDKIGKSQAEQKDGLALQQAVQGAVNQKKNDQRVRSVTQTQNTGDGAEAVKDKGGNKQGSEQGGKGGEREEAEDEESQDLEVVRDPQLGRHVDLSG